MMDLLKSFKTEINPTPEQITKITKTIEPVGIYTILSSYNLKRYEQGEKFIWKVL
ncbi:MAG: helix-turn-helix domain-containing protein [Lachnospiraceae bacterium]